MATNLKEIINFRNLEEDVSIVIDSRGDIRRVAVVSSDFVRLVYPSGKISDCYEVYLASEEDVRDYVEKLEKEREGCRELFGI